MIKFLNVFHWLFPGILAAVLLVLLAYPPEVQAIECKGPFGPPGVFPDDDLEVTGRCELTQGGVYAFRNVHIYSTNPSEEVTDPCANGPALVFDAGAVNTHFWAQSILVEKDGCLQAGDDGKPIGSNKETLTIHLYGMGQGKGGKGVPCKNPRCGVPADIWKTNPSEKTDLPGGVNDYFYRYTTLPFDDGDSEAFFGYKMLGVSYGATVRLFGKKGATYNPVDANGNIENFDPSDSGTSWVRLAKTLNPGDKKLLLNRGVNWEVGDRIVVTTTDYLPGHSEELQLTGKIIEENLAGYEFVRIDPTTNKPTETGVKYFHNGDVYDLSKAAHPGIDRLSLDITVDGQPAADTRAAVALLTRSIRIVSATSFPSDAKKRECDYDCFPTSDGFIGGHMLVRQGVKEFRVQGVEFYQMGQGGRLGHYPVHFHQTRKTPDEFIESGVPKGTFVKDSSVHDSMTRCYVLHGAHGVLLARNVGYKSIGHCFYIEDGTEINNKLYSNIGIFARAAIDNIQNPRKVPGILARGNLGGSDFPYNSDFSQPTVFWIMNGWNDFEYNMAAGAGACGACYWLVPGANSGPSKDQIWESYASMQKGEPRAATTPLKTFRGNYCTTAMNSFNTVGATDTCLGLAELGPIQNTLAPDPKRNATDTDYPITKGFGGGGGRFPTRCPGVCSNDMTLTCQTDSECNDGSCQIGGTSGDCSQVLDCANGQRDNCMVTVLDKYTSAFHWTETNFAAIWLRPQWYLVNNSVLSDVQNGGLSFVTGGDYTASNFIPGQWMLARRTAFIGNTQSGVCSSDVTRSCQLDAECPDDGTCAGVCSNNATMTCNADSDCGNGTCEGRPNPFAANTGPFNPQGLECADGATNRCYKKDEGISMPLSSFGNNQRLFNIYDGPSYEDSNAYLDITTAPIGDCPAPNPNQQCNNSDWMYGKVLGMRRSGNVCFLPNAAIAWKQPNGFYYPPAFHSTNLFFDNVDIRHFVIEPQFVPGTFKTTTDTEKIQELYCTWNPTMFDNFSGIDRQTELNDDDGSLTGLVNTISVNEDTFFNAPVETVECRSDGTAKTSPYDYVTTVVYPGCAARGSTSSCLADPKQPWNSPCSNEVCYGVPLYRQLINDAETYDLTQEIRMMGMDLFQRSNLTVNNGVYYIDTTASTRKQAGVCRQNVLITVDVDCTDPENLTKKVGDFPNKNIPNTENQKACDCNLNVFRGGQTYYVFFLYAKPSTKQTYQIFVGEGLDSDAFNVKRDVNLVRADIFKSKELGFDEEDWHEGPAVLNPWKRDYDSSTGILTVTVDLADFEKEFEAAREDLCQPQSFCEWDDGSKTCGCSEELKNFDMKLYDECTKRVGSATCNSRVCSDDASQACSKDADCGRTICSWAGNDIDCPMTGCFGFGVKLPAGFTADVTDPDESPHRPVLPKPEGCFPNNDIWNVSWTHADPPIAGSCFPPLLGLTQFCDAQFAPMQTRNVIMGTDAGERIKGTSGDDIIVAGGGDDRVIAKKGNDWVSGGSGDDKIKGGEGNDVIMGDEGDDILKGGKGNDVILGGEGDDKIKGNKGNDELDGGDDTDKVIGGRGVDMCSGGEKVRSCEMF